MPDPGRKQLLRGATVTGAGTLASRVVGMLRDAATAALLGISGSPVMDAFVMAFRVPNFFRSMLGEGALAASFLPVMTAELERDRASAWRLASVTLVWLALLLCGLVLVGELLLAALAYAYPTNERLQLMLGLSAVLLPYMLFVCLAALTTAALHAVGNFSVSALPPVVLNIVWLLVAVFAAPRLANQTAQAYLLAATITLAGILQWLIQVPTLRRHGFRFDYDARAAWPALVRVGKAMTPMLLGLAITQLNTIVDSFIAYAFVAPPDTSAGIAWLGGIAYPLTQGAVGALYYGQRLFQFPLGILGLAVATAIYPLLSRHAARNEWASVGRDLTHGLRLVAVLAIPASVGLMLLAEPITQLLFERGEFSRLDTLRTADVVRWYGPGVWAFCALPVLVRGCYALNDQRTPVRLGMVALGSNVLFDLLLMWSMAEGGLALASSLSAVVQTVMLAWWLSRGPASLDWRQLGATLVRALLASAAMWAAGMMVEPWQSESAGTLVLALRLGFTLLVCLAVYFAALAVLPGRELTIFRHAAGDDAR